MRLPEPHPWRHPGDRGHRRRAGQARHRVAGAVTHREAVLFHDGEALIGVRLVEEAEAVPAGPPEPAARYAPARGDGTKPYVVTVSDWGKRAERLVYVKERGQARYAALGRATRPST